MDKIDKPKSRDYDAELSIIREIANRNNSLNDSVIEYLSRSIFVEQIDLIYKTSSTSRNTDAE